MDDEYVIRGRSRHGVEPRYLGRSMRTVRQVRYAHVMPRTTAERIATAFMETGHSNTVACPSDFIRYTIEAVPLETVLPMPTPRAIEQRKMRAQRKITPTYPALWAQAVAAGKLAVNITRVDAPYGTASIIISRATHPFALWCKREGIGNKRAPNLVRVGGWEIPVIEGGRSVERKFNYARAAAKVLADAGIPASATSSLE